MNGNRPFPAVPGKEGRWERTVCYGQNRKKGKERQTLSGDFTAEGSQGVLRLLSGSLHGVGVALHGAAL